MTNRTAAAVGRTLMTCQLHRGRSSAGTLALRIFRSEGIAVSDQRSWHRRTQTRTRCFKHLVSPRALVSSSPCSDSGSGSGSGTTARTNTSAHLNQQQTRYFQNEASFHEVADETLEAIQDAVEELFEDQLEGGGGADDSEVPEINVASGVLTLSMPPHGTWVLNKQTPNRQIWWSSPISGPRRYEYDAEEELWLYTRYVDARDAARDDGTDLNEDEYGDGRTLGRALASEIKMLYGLDLDLDM